MGVPSGDVATDGIEKPRVSYRCNRAGTANMVVLLNNDVSLHPPSTILPGNGDMQPLTLAEGNLKSGPLESAR